MPYHYFQTQEVNYRVNEINKIAQQRNLAWIAAGSPRRKTSQRVLRIVGQSLIYLGERLSQQADQQKWPATTPAEPSCC